MILSSCSIKPITNHDIDNYISKNNNDSFPGLNNIFIAQRSEGFGEITFVINRFEGGHTVYFATLHLARNAVTDISTLDSGAVSPGDHISNEEIENAARIIDKYKLFLLGVDSSGNIYVNPFFMNQPPYLMRLNIATGDSIVKKKWLGVSIIQWELVFKRAAAGTLI